MVKRSQRSSEAVRGTREPNSRSAATPAKAEPAPKRKPYQRPVVQKRRSIAEATLFSGSGVSGTLVS